MLSTKQLIKRNRDRIENLDDALKDIPQVLKDELREEYTSIGRKLEELLEYKKLMSIAFTQIGDIRINNRAVYEKLCWDCWRVFVSEPGLPKEAAGWRDAEDPPEDDRYILLSFANFSEIMIGRFEVDKDGGGNYYLGDNTAPTLELIVEEWHELPRRGGRPWE